MRNRKKIVTIITILAIAAYWTVYAAYVINFPSAITLTEYSTHRLTLGMPFRGTIQNETVNVIKVNNKPVENNITVSLQDPLTIETDAEGRAELTINAFGIPLKKVMLDIVPDMEVIPCGVTIGVRINTNGVMVLGTGSVRCDDGTVIKPCEGKLRAGDLILCANGEDMKSKEDLIKAIANSRDGIEFQVQRDGDIFVTAVTPVTSSKEKSPMIGVWVRDSTQGIGTITYYNPSTRAFGALGHGIMDVDTKKLMSVKSGVIMSASVTSVKKGAKGMPGELEGEIQTGKVLGQIKTNSPYGIYGVVDLSVKGGLPGQTVKVATQSQIHEGPAVIRTNVSGNIVKEYDIYVESVNRYASDETKGMVIRITDPELLKLTNGIVQGMSGSPILQDDRIIGAVTHVFVQDPTKGYGIFIENMIRQEEHISAFNLI